MNGLIRGYIGATWVTALGLLSDQLLWWAVKLLPDGEDKAELAGAVMHHYQRIYGKET